MLVLGVTHIAAGLLLVIEARRASAGPVMAHRPHWVQAARQALDIIRTPWARVVLAGAFLEGMLMFGAFAYVGADLHHRFGAGLGLVGVTIAAFGAGALLYSLCAGYLVPRFGQPMMVALGSICLALGYATLTVMPWFWLAAPAVALLGLGFYMLHNTLQTEATQMAPETRGLAVSMFAIMLFTGQAAGVALAGPVVDRWSARPVFLFAALALLGVAWWLRRQLLRRMRLPRG
jgi:predicted MFS family arabinose efflux permease